MEPGMTDADATSGSRACGGDVAAYALGALDPHEVETFRRHLETCAICRDELAAFEEVVDTLPLSGPVQPAPADLRRRIMRAVDDEAKPVPPHRRAPAPRAPRTRRRLPLPALGFATALAVAVAVFVGVESNSSQSSGARIIRAQVSGRGTAELKLAGGHAELVVHHFAAPPAGQIYEVWLQRGSHAPSPTAALFSVTAAGDGDVDVPGSLHGVSLVMVTPEPAGGSGTPTHPPVISARLT
jgi:Anti-sigma-K factor rskA/Putative zinc-finger